MEVGDGSEYSRSPAQSLADDHRTMSVADIQPLGGKKIGKEGHDGSEVHGRTTEEFRSAAACDDHSESAGTACISE